MLSRPHQQPVAALRIVGTRPRVGCAVGKPHIGCLPFTGCAPGVACSNLLLNRRPVGAAEGAYRAAGRTLGIDNYVRGSWRKLLAFRHWMLASRERGRTRDH